MQFLERLRSGSRQAAPAAPPSGLTPAAVLIAVERQRESILFVERSASVRTHGGQVGLPGGRVEPGEDPFAAALREASEEVSLEPTNVEFVSALDPMETNSNYFVHSFVCTWQQATALEPDGVEIDRCFEVPAAFLLEASNCRKEVWSRHDREREVYFWEYEGHTIWGVTGGLLARFFQAATGFSLSAQLPVSPSRQAEFMRRFQRPEPRRSDRPGE